MTENHEAELKIYLEIRRPLVWGFFSILLKQKLRGEPQQPNSQWDIKYIKC